LGSRPEPGKRNDIAAIVAKAKTGATDEEILDELPVAARYGNAINFTRFAYSEKISDRQLQGVRVIVIYGPTGKFPF